MTPKKIPVWLTVALAAAAVVFSIPHGVPSVIPIICFAALCIFHPSPFPAICPVLSFAATYIISSGNDPVYGLYMAAYSIFYVLPGAVIALAYFKKSTKSQCVLAGAAAAFVYVSLLVVWLFVLIFGKFDVETVNFALDNAIAGSMERLNDTISSFGANSAALASGIDVSEVEKAMNTAKPLVPSVMIVFCFLMSYASVCALNLILKLTGYIEKTVYKYVPTAFSAAVFLLSLILGLFLGLDTLPGTICASFTMILAPAFFIVGFGAVRDLLARLVKNTVVLNVITVIAAVAALTTMMFNFFYFFGCWSILASAIRNRRKGK